jgi:hypothetical protein
VSARPAASGPAWMRSLLVRLAAGKTTETDGYWLDPLKVMTAAGMTPDPWQGRVLRSTARNLLACCGRQFGKSAVFGALAARTAIVEAPALVLLLSASQRQSAEFFQKHVVQLMQRLKWPVRPVRTPNVFSLELTNGSRIIALPDNQEAVVGYSAVDLLLIDEASRVSDALYHYTSPMLAVSKGRLAALSTPFGKRGWFFEEWENGTGWEKHKVTASGEGCPRIGKAFLAAELRRKGPKLYEQEYEAEFRDAVDALIPGSDIDAAFAAQAAAPDPLFAEGEFGDAW